MKVSVRVRKEIDVRFIKLDAGVRYWEDSEINGKEDVDLYESKGNGVPMMPFAVKVKDECSSNIYSDHYRWQPVIDIETGRIVDWPKGTTADVHYKVCDDGRYILLDADKKELVDVNSYVPNFIGKGGDYIVMTIDGDGYIAGFNCNESDIEDLIKGDFDYEE